MLSEMCINDSRRDSSELVSVPNSGQRAAEFLFRPLPLRHVVSAMFLAPRRFIMIPDLIMAVDSLSGTPPLQAHHASRRASGGSRCDHGRFEFADWMFSWEFFLVEWSG
jgi:hypothetical protein